MFKVDWVIVYWFDVIWVGIVIVELVVEGYFKVLGVIIVDFCFVDSYVEKYCFGCI